MDGEKSLTKNGGLRKVSPKLEGENSSILFGGWRKEFDQKWMEKRV
jgi:hypothetical protein